MSTTMTQGSVTLTCTETLQIPDKAGKMSVEEVSRIEKARRGVGITCERTAEALRKNEGRITVPGVTPEALEQAGKAADDIDGVIADLEHLLLILKQSNVLLDAHAHRELRKVLAAVRAQEKFDPRLPDLFPQLIAYFATTRGNDGGAPPTGTPE